LCKTILKFPLPTQFFFKDNFQLYITKPFSKNKFKPKGYKQANFRCNLLTFKSQMMNIVGLNFQLPIAKQIWLLEILKIYKKQSRIEICKGSMKNLTCDSAMCITTSLTLWPWCMLITSGYKILILMLKFWIWTNRKSWFKNDAMCNVVRQLITPKPLINYQSLNSTLPFQNHNI
jgi:hypothetical protein